MSGDPDGLERIDRGLARLLDPVRTADDLGATRPAARRGRPVADATHP